MLDIETREDLSADGWLSLLPSTLQTLLLDECVLREAPAGKILYRHGDPPDGVCCVLSGCIRMDTFQSAHGPTMLSLFHARSWLGEVEVFSGMPRIVTLTAHRPVRYAYLAASRIEEIGKGHPIIWRALGHLSAEHVSLAVAALDDLAIRSSSLRLIAVLLRLCGARLDVLVGEVVRDIDVTHSELAQLTNLSRSMVGSILDDMERKGQIKRNYGKLRIIEVEALRKRLHEDVSVRDN